MVTPQFGRFVLTATLVAACGARTSQNPSEPVAGQAGTGAGASGAPASVSTSGGAPAGGAPAAGGSAEAGSTKGGTSPVIELPVPGGPNFKPCDDPGSAEIKSIPGGEQGCQPELAPTADGELMPPKLDCSNAGEAPPRGSCPRLEITIHPDRREATCAEHGVVIEPLQIPEKDEYGPVWLCTSSELNPASWDSTERPLGAAVFRLHGVDTQCYPRGFLVIGGTCAALAESGEFIAPNEFHENFECSAVPGCPPPQRGHSEPGNWHYVVPQGPDTLDVVICAAQYFEAFSGGNACLRLAPWP